MSAGYSGRKLADKLGLKPGLRAWRVNMPASVATELGGAWLAAPEPGLDFAFVSTASRAELEALVAELRPLLAPAGMIWVSWPKKASKVATDITEDVVREVALPHGLVDVKVCAVDETWSGLKLVIRKALRE